VDDVTEKKDNSGDASPFQPSADKPEEFASSPQNTEAPQRSEGDAWMSAFDEPATPANTATATMAAAVGNAVESASTEGDFATQWKNGLSDHVHTGIEEALKMDDATTSSGAETPEATQDQAPKASDDGISNMQRLLSGNSESLLQVSRRGHLVSVKLHRGQR